MILIMILPAIALAISSCKDKDPEPDLCERVRNNFDPTFGIDYLDTAHYLVPGAQSTLDPSYLTNIHASIGPVNPTLNGLRKVTEWVNQTCTFVDAKGAKIGLVTANELYEKKEIYGCHSAALLISSIIRSYGIPVLMVETADVQWALDYSNGTAETMGGHVMNEVFVQSHWILLDNDGSLVDLYKPWEPFISRDEDPPSLGLFTIAKGIDCWEYGVHAPEDTHNLMIRFAKVINCYSEYLNTNDYSWLLPI